MQSNPIARWHICQGSINSIAFSTDGTYLATVGRDGMMSILYHLHLVFFCVRDLIELKSFTECRLFTSF